MRQRDPAMDVRAAAAVMVLRRGHVLAAATVVRRRAPDASERDPDHDGRHGLRRSRQLRSDRHQDAESGPPGAGRRTIDRRVCQRRALQPDPGGADQRTVSAAQCDRDGAWSGRHARPRGDRHIAAAAPQERRLSHGARRQVASGRHGHRGDARRRSAGARIRRLLRPDGQPCRLLAPQPRAQDPRISGKTRRRSRWTASI